MDRIEMIKFINEKVLPDAEIDSSDWHYNGREIFHSIRKAISRWRIGKPLNIEMRPQIIDGVLYMNGEPVERVAAKLPRKPFDEASYYWEGRCLHDNYF